MPVSLHSFCGKVVILAFNDSECTTVCPLRISAMLDAKAMLSKAGSRVQLLETDANPAATSLEDFWSYSELHGMLLCCGVRVLPASDRRALGSQRRGLQRQGEQLGRDHVARLMR